MIGRLGSIALLAAVVSAGCSDRVGDVAPPASEDPIHGEQPATVLGALEIYRPMAPAPAAGDQASVYLTVRNTGTAPDTLTGLATEGAAGGSLPSSEIRDGTARMTPVEPQPAPPGGYLILEPGGLHGMLTGLTRRLTPGDTLDVTITFARAGSVVVRVPVISYADLTSDGVARPGG